MTQKDYIKLALALREAYPIPENNTPDSAWRHCVAAVVGALKEDNPKFNEEQFLDAAGY